MAFERPHPIAIANASLKCGRYLAAMMSAGSRSPALRRPPLQTAEWNKGINGTRLHNERRAVRRSRCENIKPASEHHVSAPHLPRTTAEEGQIQKNTSSTRGCGAGPLPPRSA
jgi:hypothetical protein